jgi:hypothetical protein
MRSRSFQHQRSAFSRYGGATAGSKAELAGKPAELNAES